MLRRRLEFGDAFRRDFERMLLNEHGLGQNVGRERRSRTASLMKVSAS